MYLQSERYKGRQKIGINTNVLNLFFSKKFIKVMGLTTYLTFIIKCIFHQRIIFHLMNDTDFITGLFN